MAASLYYRPEQSEQPYYLALFKAADVQGRGTISGAEAVKFFGRSKLPVEVLKNIWTVSDQPSTSSLDLKKFAVAVRLIQLTQNGQKGKGQNLEAPSGVVLKPVFFEGVSGVTVPMPPSEPQQKAGGMPPPHPTPQQPNRAMPPPQQTYGAPAPPGPQPGSTPPSPRRKQQPSQPPQQPAVPMSPSRALVGMDPYTLSPQERQRYESLFPSYAKTEEDGSQFVYGSEAVPLFMKSGVDPNKLRDIWNMVDRNPVDNRLDKLEFALAMHLIVCVSKKNLPMPPGGTLPNSLMALKAATSGGAPPAQVAPQTAPEGAAPPPQPVQTQMPPPPAETAMPPPAASMGMGMGGPPPLGGPGSGAMGGMSISDAFEGMSTMDSVADYSQPPPEPEPEAPAALPSYVPEAAPTPAAVPTPAVVPEPPTPQMQPTYVEQPESPKPAVIQAPPAPVPVAPAPVANYEVSDSHMDELTKLKSVVQKLQAENISLKAQLGNMTEEEKNVQQELGQTMTEITALTADLGFQRKEVMDAKNRLLEAKAELKANRETKGVLTELISEAKETTEAIESATETLRTTTEVQQSAPPVAETADLFDMGYSNPVGAPPPAAETPAMPPQQGFEGFSNEAGMSGGVTSATTPPTQPTGDIVAPGSTQQEQQQLSIPEPSGQVDMYSNYAAPLAGGYPPPAAVPPQQEAGGYPPPAAVPPQQEAGGYPPPAAVPPQQEAGGYGAPAPMPPQQQMGGYPAPAPLPQVPEAGGYPAAMPPQQQTPLQQRQMAAPGHVRNSSGFDEGFLMGGSAEPIPQDTSRDNDNFSVAARSVASTGTYGYDEGAYEIVENMKKKAKKADGAARDAEAAHRKLAAEADELRTDADRAEANARSLAAQAAPPDDKKKKGRFGGGSKKKGKKAKEEAEQAAKDAALIKSHFMAIQSQALEAQNVAAQTRAEADRLRDEAEAAELDMAAAASKKQKQPAPQPPQAQAPPPAAGGYAPQPQYGAPPPQQQQYPGQAPQYGMPNGGPAMMPPNGGYNNYANGMGGAPYGQQQPAYGAPPQMSHPDPSKSAPGVMGNGGGNYGGYEMPSPATYGGDPYVSPF